MSAKKYDQAKPKVQLIEPDFILGMADVLTFGAGKYGEYNWQGGEASEFSPRLYGAALRHLLAYRKGEQIDPESGLKHLHHAAVNLMMCLWYDNKESEGASEQEKV